ncbi:MAG TPA: helix-turn-helix transcriptional regulator [Chitinophagaceae bacterium]|nr:helix-turn-helix transcriptional regulator [Chitinophagaceae bacterium]HRX94830.1 helix-turn-helix transcriptional regulator [Chitinophagaceae bacterium]
MPAYHEKLKQLRKKHRLNQTDVAAALNMSQNAYSLLESGKTKMDIDRLTEIAKFYKMSIYDIVEDLPPPKKIVNY